MRCEEKFKEIYSREPELGFCPYRICPLGAHIDHQLGIVEGMAINKGIYFAYGPKRNGVIELNSLDFGKRAQFHCAAAPEVKENDWADYLRGVTKELNERHPLRMGLCGVFEGELPIGGLSSSAAVSLVFLKALCKVNNIVLDPFEMVAICKSSENNYVGVSSGKLDQCTEILSRKDQLLYLDTRDDSYELIPRPENMKPYEILILFSGVERALKSSSYNVRVDECKSAAYNLTAQTTETYGHFKDAYLRDVEPEIFEKYGSLLPKTFYKRALHYFGEMERVQKGKEAWAKGDIEAFGRLVFESGASSIVNYEAGSPELKAIYDLMVGEKGVYGGRFSGAGFKGCLMAFVDPKYREEIIAHITEGYLKDFPQYKDSFRIFVCESADGVLDR